MSTCRNIIFDINNTYVLIIHLSHITFSKVFVFIKHINFGTDLLQVEECASWKKGGHITLHTRVKL